MASSRLSGPGRPWVTLAFALAAAVVALAAPIVGAGCDEGAGVEFAPPPAAGPCDARGCTSGVRIEVPDLATLAPGPLPLAFRVCLDGGCTDLALRGEPRAPSCEVVGEPPADQFARCSAAGPGPLAFDVASFGARRDRALVALSARDAAGATLFHDAAEVALEPVYANGPACGATCARGEVTFRAGAGR